MCRPRTRLRALRRTQRLTMTIVDGSYRYFTSAVALNQSDDRPIDTKVSSIPWSDGSRRRGLVSCIEGAIMKYQHASKVIVLAASILAVTMALAAQSQDRFTLKSSNGIAFSEFKGYEAWQLISTSQHDGTDGCGTSKDGCAKAILGNPIMIQAHRDGIPANGQPVPDGAAMAKIEWLKTTNEAAPYQITEPGVQTEVAFMVKDSKRFPRHERMGIRDAAVRRRVEHLQTARRPDQSLIREVVPWVPHRPREIDRLRLHQLCEAVTTCTPPAGDAFLAPRR